MNGARPILAGAPRPAALQALLASRGTVVARQVLFEALGDDTSSEGIAELLRLYDLRARLVRIGFSELRHLACPTLLFVEGDAALVLVRVHRRSVEVQDPARSSGETIVVSFAELATIWHGSTLELTSRAEQPPELTSRAEQPLQLTQLSAAKASIRGDLRGSLARLGGPLLYVVLVSMGLLLAGLAVPIATQLAMDWALPDGAPGLLAAVAAGILVVAAFQALLGWLRDNAVIFLEARLVGDLARTLLERILRLPFPILHGGRVGDHVQLMTGAQVLGQSVMQLFLGPAIDGVLALAYLGFLVYWLPLAGAAAAILVVLVLFVTVYAGRRQAKLQHREIAAQAIQSDYLLELLSGITTVKTGLEAKAALTRWLGRLARERWPGLDRQRSSLYHEVVVDVARSASLVVVLLLGGRLALEAKLTAGTVLACVQLSQALWDAIAKLGDAWLKLSLVVPHIERIDATLAHGATPTRGASAHQPLRRCVGVTLDKVWFRHSSKRPWVLSDYSLKVAPGEHLRLRGRSGWGKTTILRLLAGLYEPEQGIVTVGDMAPAAARHLVAYLPQEAVLYGGSILENLRLLSARAPRDRLLAAAAATGLDDFVRTLPMGYETILPPRGSTLSAGQRQLVALTAGLASARPVLLLDEAMSHLDRISQDRILSSALFGERTVISVVHDRFEDEADADRISRRGSLVASASSAMA